MNTTLTAALRLAWVLRVLAIFLLLAMTAFWWSTGSHVGWSKDRVEVVQVDPITEIEYVEYEDRFVMGVEYLAVSYVAAFLLLLLSFWVGHKAFSNHQ